MTYFIIIFNYKIEYIISAENIVANSLMLDTTDNSSSNEISDVVNWVEE